MTLDEQVALGVRTLATRASRSLAKSHLGFVQPAYVSACRDALREIGAPGPHELPAQLCATYLALSAAMETLRQAKKKAATESEGGTNRVLLLALKQTAEHCEEVAP